MTCNAALLLASAIVLAGCLGGDGPAAGGTLDTAETVGSADATVAEDGTLLYVARFADAELVDVTEWYNGTFRIEEHRRVGPVPSLTDTGAMLSFDITKHIPNGVPTRVIAEVNADLAYGDVDLGLMVPQGEWRTGNWDTPTGGYSRFETGLVHTSTEPIVVMLSYDEVEPQPEFTYTLSIRVVSDPAQLVNGIVAGVTLPADAKLTLEALGEPREQGPEVEAFALHVFGPDDALVGTFPLAGDTTVIPLPAGSPAGEYAFLLSQGGRNALVTVEGTPALMRALGIEWESGGIVELDATGRGSATATFDRAPLLAGLFFTAPNVARNVQASLAGPGGELFAFTEATDVPWISFSIPNGPGMNYGWGWDSLWGAPGLAAGSYEASVAFENGAGAQPAVAEVFAAFPAR